ncbi:MAG: transglycosylase domain-containing protein, partial [Deltaproteobacteria bacterium]|nr:transglycosylase domain-containing protein [Deltaproteobacteria bacterium]
RNDARIGVVYGEPKVCVKKKGKDAAPIVVPETVDDKVVDEAVEQLRKANCTTNDDCDKSFECKPAEHETRTFVPYEKLPKTLIDALIATEDNSFWDHGGVDYTGMFRAFWANLRAGKAKQGASTITQQVVKNLLLTPEKSFKRKIQEIIIARRLEKVLTKEEILTLYLNQVNFGNARYGVAEAARFYFGKDVSQLDVGESAMLAGLPQSPETLAPNRKKSQAAAKARQVHVLNRLAEMSAINPTALRGKPLSYDEAKKWIDASVGIIQVPFPQLNTAPEWERRVREELLVEKCGGKATCPEGESYLDFLGATVRTTLDPAVHAAAQRALQTGLRAVDKRASIGRPKRSLKNQKAVDELLKKLSRVTPESRLVKGESYEAVVTAVHDDDRELEIDLGSFKAGVIVDDERYLPVDDDGKVQLLSTRFKANDVVEVVHHPDDKPTKHAKHRVAFPRGPEGAIVVLEVKTRKVRALVGGYSIKRGGLNRATDSKRQPGSSFKPYVMAAGIQLGAGKAVDQAGHITYTPASMVIDAPDPDDRLGIKRWLPKNFESGNFEGPVLLRHALAKSINTVAIRIFNKISPQLIIDLTTAAGLDTSKFPTSPALALGAGEVTLLDHTNAMTTFAAGGKSAKPVFIDAINGKATAGSPTTQVVDPAVAYVTVDMMRSVVTSGTGVLAQKVGVPVAGKTGTSNDHKDVWFIGLTPDYAIGVWIGHDEPRSMGRETGGTTAVPVFVEVAKSLKLAAKPFPRPPKVVEVKIDKKSGLKAPDDWPKAETVTEVFVEGTAPTETATADGDDVKKAYDD